MGFIYKITNSITHDYYIGKTKKTPEERFQRHLYNAKYGIDTHLYRAIRKYGTPHFSVETITEVPDDQLNTLEIELIEKLSPPYNMSTGGDGGNTYYFITEETREKLRRRSAGPNNPMYGKKGPSNPKWGRKYGKKPAISKALKNPCVCNGVTYSSIGEAEKDYRGVCSVRKRLDNPKYENWYRLVPKTSR